MRPVAVVAAIIESEAGPGRRILLAERPPGKHLAGLWEFPGGKREDGESAERALRRELREELELRIEILRPLGLYSHLYSFGLITLDVFVVRALDSPRLTEAVQKFRWSRPEEIDLNALCPADVAPWRDYLKSTFLKRSSSP